MTNLNSEPTPVDDRPANYWEYPDKKPEQKKSTNHGQARSIQSANHSTDNYWETDQTKLDHQKYADSSQKSANQSNIQSTNQSTDNYWETDRTNLGHPKYADPKTSQNSTNFWDFNQARPNQDAATIQSTNHTTDNYWETDQSKYADSKTSMYHNDTSHDATNYWDNNDDRPKPTENARTEHEKYANQPQGNVQASNGSTANDENASVDRYWQTDGYSAGADEKVSTKDQNKDLENSCTDNYWDTNQSAGPTEHRTIVQDSTAKDFIDNLWKDSESELNYWQDYPTEVSDEPVKKVSIYF